MFEMSKQICKCFLDCLDTNTVLMSQPFPLHLEFRIATRLPSVDGVKKKNPEKTVLVSTKCARCAQHEFSSKMTVQGQTYEIVDYRAGDASFHCPEIWPPRIHSKSHSSLSNAPS